MGRSRDELSSLSEDQLADVDILVLSGVGANAAKKADVQVGRPSPHSCDLPVCACHSVIRLV